MTEECNYMSDLSDPLFRMRLNLEALGNARYLDGTDRFHAFCVKHGIDEQTDNRRLARLSDKAVLSLDKQLKLLEQKP